MLLYHTISPVTPYATPKLADTTVLGVDVNMVVFLFGLAAAAALVTFAVVHNPKSSRIRAKHRF